ncbi:hypothetical protein NPIL_552351 [Nephila pilipes]|uniref:Uncharacterized protein n=1 Tax=Nephila pilipes TaxID=299642 RepID=A0A8X6Q4V7_NEPPI|nr:hypothetical protein NPIL_552351 [Nephila pilipes]
MIRNLISLYFDKRTRIQRNNLMVECKEQKQVKNTIPIVKSFTVHKMRLTLDFEAQFDGFENRCNFTIKQKFLPREKPSVPTVQSLTVLKICESLGLEAQLLSTPGKNFMLSKQNTKTKSAPVVRSFMVYKMCLALEIDVKLDTEKEFD